MSGYIQLPKPRRGPRRILQARYDDTCGICLRDIHQGDNIEMTNDGVIHYGCKEDDGEEGQEG